MDLFMGLLSGFSVAMTWHNLLYCLIGVTVGQLVGASRHWPDDGDGAAHSADLRHAASLGDHHAFRDLLRRNVWRYDYLGPDHPR